MGRQKQRHEFCLADIDEACIVGLDLLAHWGASVDVACSTLTIGQTTHKLHARVKRKRTVRRVWQHRMAAVESESLSVNTLSEALKQHWREPDSIALLGEVTYPVRMPDRRRAMALQQHWLATYCSRAF